MQWGAIYQLEGKYEVSRCGQVRSLLRKNPIVLKQQMSNAGYKQVQLFNGSFYEYRTVHSLVAGTFVSGYDDGLEVDHKDGNKLNNAASNLEWVTRCENQLRKLGFTYELNHDVHGVHTTRNLTQFAKDNNLIQSCLARVANGGANKHKGWRVVKLFS